MEYSTSVFTHSALPKEIKNKITGVSYKENPDITLDDLSYLKLSYIDFDGNDRVGEMICAKSLAGEVCEIFHELYEAHYQIEKIRLPDEYGADDNRIMADNNTSCFNYRTIANTSTVSMHGKGRAIDINPLYNPYIQNGIVMPENAVPYADRDADFPHKITHEDTCFKIFARHGWRWGGDWQNSKDYQHFYKPDSRIKRLIAQLRKQMLKYNNETR